MKLIVGLGNPGTEYDKTRHNAGFMVVDRLAERHAAGVLPKGKFHALVWECRVGTEKCLLMKPTTYMNRSGLAIGEAARFYKVDTALDLLVVVDDTAVPCGGIRLRAEGGAGGHNGLADIQQKLGGPGYPRLRVGIDQPPPRVVLHDYVLGRFSPEQREALEPAIGRGADAAECFVASGIETAMNRFNEKFSSGSSQGGAWGRQAEPADGGGDPPSGPVKEEPGFEAWKNA
ncbi:MAG: aminoacyl-tRNA hydrolase [Planctomycetota bacterium]